MLKSHSILEKDVDAYICRKRILNVQVYHRYPRAVRVNSRATLKHLFGRLDSADDKGQVAECLNRHYVGYAQTKIQYGVSDVKIKGGACPLSYSRAHAAYVSHGLRDGIERIFPRIGRGRGPGGIERREWWKMYRYAQRQVSGTRRIGSSTISSMFSARGL